MMLARLAEIERIIDRTTPDEDPPYRNDRRKLNNEKAAILRALEGDPRFEATGEIKRMGGLNKKQKIDYETRKTINKLKEVVND